MTTDAETISLTIIADQIKYMRDDVKNLGLKLDASNENKVSHREWAQRNEHVNNRLSALGKEVSNYRAESAGDIAELRTEIRAKSAPWWSVGAMVIAGLALGWNIVEPAFNK